MIGKSQLQSPMHEGKNWNQVSILELPPSFTRPCSQTREKKLKTAAVDGPTRTQIINFLFYYYYFIQFQEKKGTTQLRQKALSSCSLAGCERARAKAENLCRPLAQRPKKHAELDEREDGDGILRVNLERC